MGTGQSCCTSANDEQDLNLVSLRQTTPQKENVEFQAELDLAEEKVNEMKVNDSTANDTFYGENLNEVNANEACAQNPHFKAGLPMLRMKIQIEHEEKSNVGLNLDVLEGGAAFVDDVTPGLVEKWNATHPPEQRLLANDKIISINGIHGDANNIVANMKSSTTWDMLVLRASIINVTFEFAKSGGLGLDLKYSPTGRSLVISAIGPGNVREWNETSPDKVACGDRIISINGQSGLPKTILAAATLATSLDLSILHYPQMNVLDN